MKAYFIKIEIELLSYIMCSLHVMKCVWLCNNNHNREPYHESKLGSQSRNQLRSLILGCPNSFV